MADTQTVLIPGPQGAAGTNGTNGTNGANAVAITSANFTTPAAYGSTVIVNVDSTAWMAAGQPVWVGSLSTFYIFGEITLINDSTSFTLKILDVDSPSGQVNIGTSQVIPGGARVSPAGVAGTAGVTGLFTALDFTGSNITSILNRAITDLTGVLLPANGGAGIDTSALNGLAKLTLGVVSAAVAGTDYPAVAHEASHIRGGASEIDGDQVDVDYTPTSYTRSVAPAEVSHVEHLTAHLAGINNVLALIGNSREILLGSLLGADFNIVTDQVISFSGSGASTYIISKIIVTNASVDLSAGTAAGGFYNNTGKPAGGIFVAAAQTYNNCTSATGFEDTTLAGVALTDVQSGANAYLSLTAGHGVAATADVYVFGHRIL